MTSQLDYPFHEVIAQADEILAKDPRACIYQKFTCSSCGQRLTIDTPNTFHTSGTCDKCGSTTDILAQGCNYLLTINVPLLQKESSQ